MKPTSSSTGRRPLQLFHDGELAADVTATANAAGGVTVVGTPRMDEDPYNEHAQWLSTVFSAMRATDFSLGDFWEGYKHFAFASYSGSNAHRAMFLGTKMFAVIQNCTRVASVRWNQQFQQLVMTVWEAMEDYLEPTCGAACRDLRTMMALFEDPQELLSTEDGRILMHFYESLPEGGIQVPTPTLPTIRFDDHLLTRIEAELQRGPSSTSHAGRTEPGHSLQASSSVAGDGCPDGTISCTTGDGYSKVQFHFVLVGGQDRVTTAVPPGPANMSSARICKASEWEEFEGEDGHGSLQEMFILQGPAGTWWMVETDDVWSRHERNQVYAAGPTIARLCEAYRLGGGGNLRMQDCSNAEVTVFTYPLRGPWFNLLVDFMSPKDLQSWA